jgi:hypothetical protein
LADLIDLLKSDFQKFRQNGIIDVDKRRLEQLEKEVDKMRNKNYFPQTIVEGSNNPNLMELNNLVHDLTIEHRKFERLFQQLKDNIENSNVKNVTILNVEKSNVKNNDLSNVKGNIAQHIETSNGSFSERQIVEARQRKLKELSDTVDK